MKLFLASEAKHPDTMNELTKYIDGFVGKSIAYIPTAGNGEGWGCWKEGRTWPLIQTLGARVELVQLEDYRNASALAHIRHKDIIWFAGGMTGYLLYWIRRCRLDRALPEILEQGSVYVGSSAGAMVTASNMSMMVPGRTGTGGRHHPRPGFGRF